MQTYVCIFYFYIYYSIDMKSLNDYITEGAWGYDPQDNDSVLDLRSDIVVTMLEKIYDECFKRVWGGEVEADEEFHIDGNSAWEAIGTIEYFFERCSNLNEIYDSNKDPEYEKYYYWWRLKDNKKKDIVELYSDAVSRCASDKEFINDWKEPKKIEKALKERANILKRYSELRDGYFKNVLNREKERAADTIKQVKNKDHKHPTQIDAIACPHGKENIEVEDETVE